MRRLQSDVVANYVMAMFSGMRVVCIEYVCVGSLITDKWLVYAPWLRPNVIGLGAANFPCLRVL